MTKASIVAAEISGSVDTPASSKRGLYPGTDGWYDIDDTGSVTGPFGAGGGSGTPDFGAAAIKTIASGVATAGTDRHLVIAAESSTTDDLIEVSGLDVGDACIIRPDTGDTITIKHNDAGATDKIILPGAADVNMSGNDTVYLVKTEAGVVAGLVNTDSSGAGGIGGTTGGTDNAIIRADGTGGSTVQASAGTIDDSGNLAGVNIAASLITSGTLTHERGGLEANVSAFSGLLVISGGTTSQKTAPTGDVVGTTDSQTLTNKTLTQPAIGDFTSAGHDHSNAANGGDLAAAAVTSALDGATLTSATVATDDKVLIQDTNDSDNLKTVTAQSIADLASGGSPNVAVLAHKEAQNTNGGAIAVGANTLPITDILSDPNGIITSLSSNQVTLGAGDYVLWFYHYLNNNSSTGDQYLYLYNATDTVDIDNQEGGVQIPNSSTSRIGIGFLHFNLAATKAIEIRAYSSAAFADTRALGAAFNIAGRKEVYGNYIFERID